MPGWETEGEPAALQSWRNTAFSANGATPSPFLSFSNKMNTQILNRSQRYFKRPNDFGAFVDTTL